MSSTPYKILRAGALRAVDVEEALVSGMKVIGLTGGTGAGKTTALELIRAHGGLCIDCDAVYHRLLRENSDMLGDIRAHFGDGVFVDGLLDTKLLGAIVFNHPAELAELNSITHRHIDAEVGRLLREHAMAGGRLAAIDAIALIESGVARRCSRVFGIVAAADKRIERIMEREGIDHSYAKTRASAQKDESFFHRNCDEILINDGDKAEFITKCARAFGL